MSKPTITHEDLNQFLGSEAVNEHAFIPFVLFSEGIQYLAERADAYWLIDAIGAYAFSPELRKAIEVDPSLESVQFWKLVVNEDQSAKLSMRSESGCKPVIKQEIEYTDFPLNTIRIWASYKAQHLLLYLPSEF